MEEAIFKKRLMAFFDRDFYLECYSDVSDAKIDPLQHYIKLGWRESRRPNRWFNEKLVPKELVIQYPDAPLFSLFLSHLPGLTEDQFLKKCGSEFQSDVGHSECWYCDQMRLFFEGDFYRSKYVDITKNVDALVHYCELGWRENRTPALWFDPVYYLSVYSDIKEANINPFVHFISNGKAEGRKSISADPVRKKLLQNLKSFSAVSLEYKQINPKIQILSSEKFFAEVFEASANSKALCVALSHDNYLENTGGVQKFIRDESACAQKEKFAYLHLCPALPNIGLAANRVNATFLINCTLNDNFLGTFTVQEIEETIKELVIKLPKLNHISVVHSLMGWHINGVIALAGTALKHRFFYAHDYFSLCTEYRLLRNNLLPCDAPELDSNSCNICAHGRTREAHLGQMDTLFKKLKPTLLFPSNLAKNVFKNARPDFKLKGIVVPHLNVIVNEKAQVVQRRKKDKIRIAFCGAPVPHKGFAHFEQIVEACRTARGLEFYHFGTTDTKLLGVTFVEVVMKSGKSVMAKKLSEKDIDIVFVGSTWRETFNFVSYEAVQSGAGIVALSSSGNVTDFVCEQGVGEVINTWQECVSLFHSENLIQRCEEWKLAAQRLTFEPNHSFLTKGVM